MGLTLSLFQIELSFQNPTVVSEKERGNFLRGAMGFGLKEIACRDRNARSCTSCPVRFVCVYYKVFSPSNLVPIKRAKDMPRGFVIRPISDQVFELVLVGTAREFFPWLVSALQTAGKRGVSGREFRISRISVWDGTEYRLFWDRSVISPPWNSCPSIRFEIAGSAPVTETVSRIEMVFLTPTRVNSENHKAIRSVQFHHIVRSLIGRITMLSKIYCPDQYYSFDKTEFDRVVTQAKEVKTCVENLIWEFAKRVSRSASVREKKKVFQDQSGFRGKVVFEGNLGPYISLLTVGQYVHLGKNTSSGFGWYVFSKYPK